MFKKFFKKSFKKSVEDTPVQRRLSGLFGDGSSIRPSYTKRSFSNYYKTNPIAFKCVDIISAGLSGIGIQAIDRASGQVIEDHEILDFMRQPSPKESRASFFYRWSTWHNIYGQSFLQKITKGKEILELNLINPLNVDITNSGGYFPESYEVSKGSNRIKYEVDQITGKVIPIQIGGVGESTLHHLANVDSDNSFDGLSKMEVAAYAIDSFTYGMSWNRNLLQNNSLPPYSLETDSTLTTEQFQQLSEFMRKFQGHTNARKGIVLEHGLKYNTLSLSPTDMDFREMLGKMSEFIAAAFGVPLVLINTAGTTFNNLNEAKISLYRETILPLYSRLLEALSMAVQDQYPTLWLQYDEDSIQALWEERRMKIDAMSKAIGNPLLSIDEGRKELGYAERGGLAEDIFIRQGQIPLELAGEIRQEPDPDRTLEDEEVEENAEEAQD